MSAMVLYEMMQEEQSKQEETLVKKKRSYMTAELLMKLVFSSTDDDEVDDDDNRAKRKPRCRRKKRSTSSTEATTSDDEEQETDCGQQSDLSPGQSDQYSPETYCLDSLDSEPQVSLELECQVESELLQIPLEFDPVITVSQIPYEPHDEPEALGQTSPEIVEL